MTNERQIALRFVISDVGKNQAARLDLIDEVSDIFWSVLNCAPTFPEFEDTVTDLDRDRCDADSAGNYA